MGHAYLTVIFCQGIAALAAIAALRWVATYVNPDVLGRYSLYQSVVSAGALFLISWPNAALLRFGREEWTTHGRLGVTLGGRLALFVGTAGLALGLAWLLDPWLRRFIGTDDSPFDWIAAGLIVVPLAELAVYTSQAVGRTTVYGYSPLITRLGFLIGVASIPALHRPVEWSYLAACFLTATAAAAVFAFATLPHAAWSGLSVRPSVMNTLVRFSWTLPFGGLSAYVVNWIDSWVIREVWGLSSVGVYNWAYQITAVAALAFAPIAVLLTPRLIDARLRNDTVKIKRYADAILPAALLLSGAVSVGMGGVAPLLNRFGSPEYAAAYPVILILLAMLPIQLITYLVTPIANAFESLLPRIVVVSFAIALINIAGDLVLVPRLGMPGAAMATAVAFIVGAMLLIVFIGRMGVGFAAPWRYALPAVVLLPTIVGLLWGHAAAGAATILATAALTAIVGWRCLMPFKGLVGLSHALALSD
jgi:O-antigen/teichoic acid export membrane protein